MEDASSRPEAAARAVLPAPRYVLEPEWPHRAVPVPPQCCAPPPDAPARQGDPSSL